MNFAIYSRKSVYTGKGESIENQIEICKRYIISRLDGAIGDITVYEDEGFSAKNIERPQFKHMLRDINQNRFDFVVCYRLDRISRSVSDFSLLIETLNERNVSFVCVKEEFDTSKPMGKAMMYIASVFAQLERETIAERVRDNMLMLAGTGRWLGGTPPTGFKSEKLRETVVDGKIKSSCCLKPDPSEIYAVKAMFEKYLDLRSVSGVSKYLIDQNIKSRSGKPYSLPGIKDILRNPVYCTADKDALDYFTAQNAGVCFNEKDLAGGFGLLAYNKRDYTKKRVPRRPTQQWIIAAGKHKGIISGQKWAEVQGILASGKPGTQKKAAPKNGYSLLSGMIFCNKCGGRMFAKARGNNPALFDYICGSKLRGGSKLCDCLNMSGNQADEMVCLYLAPYQNENSGIYQMLENLKKELRGQIQEDTLISIEAQMKKCVCETDNLIGILSRGNLGAAEERISIRITELDTELKKLKEKQAKAKKYASAINIDESHINTVAQSLSNFKKNCSNISVAEKRTLSRILIKKIIWDGYNLRIFIGSA